MTHSTNFECWLLFSVSPLVKFGIISVHTFEEVSGVAKITSPTHENISVIEVDETGSAASQGRSGLAFSTHLTLDQVDVLDQDCRFFERLEAKNCIFYLHCVVILKLLLRTAIIDRRCPVRCDLF